MELCLSVFILILCVTLCKEKNTQDLEPRSLSTCNTVNDCSNCQLNTFCTYLNGICSDLSLSTIATDVINMTTEYQYCNYGVVDGIINMDNLSLSKLSLYHYSNSSSIEHPYCYWKITTNTPQNISVSIYHNIVNNEDIYIKAESQNNKVNYFASKNLSNCRDSIFNFTIENMTTLIIKVKQLNKNSSYRISVSIVSSSDSELPYYTYAVILFFCTMFIVCVIVTVFSKF